MILMNVAYYLILYIHMINGWYHHHHLLGMYEEGIQLFDESQSLYNRIEKKTHRYLYEGYGVNHLALVDAALRCCADGKL